MYLRSRTASSTRQLGRGPLLSALVLILVAACSDVTAPGPVEPEVPTPTVPPPVQVTLPTGRLLFVREGRIQLARAGGGEPTVVAEDAGYPSWSPDGSMIAFVRNPDIRNGDNSGFTLCIAQVDALDVRCASGDPGSYIYHSAASWSPDGTSLAYSYESSEGTSGLHILDVATMNSVEVTDFSVVSASWSPDGSMIAVVYHPRLVNAYFDYSGSLGLVAPDGSGFRTLSAGDDRYLFRGVSWSPSGGRLGFILADQWQCPMGCSVNALAVASFDGDASGGSISDLQVLDSSTGQGITWSPDEASIGFTDLLCDGDVCQSALMAVDVNGDWIAQLVTDATWPAWAR